MLYYYWGDSMEEKLKDENLIFLQIVNNYYDVNEFKKNPRLHYSFLADLKLASKEEIKRRWKVTKPYFVARYKNNFLNVNKIEEKIKEEYSKLKIEDIILYEILDFNDFLLKIMDMINLEKERISLFNTIIEKYTIVEENKQGKKIYLSPEYIKTQITDYSIYDIKQILKEYWKNDYTILSKEDYEKITKLDYKLDNPYQNIKIIHKCDRIYLSFRPIGKSQVLLYCPICKKEYKIIYHELPKINISSDAEGKNQMGWKKESELYKMGYSVEEGVSLQDRRIALTRALILKQMHKEKIIEHINWLIKRDSYNDKRVNANERRKNDINWFIRNFGR